MTQEQVIGLIAAEIALLPEAYREQFGRYQVLPFPQDRETQGGDSRFRLWIIAVVGEMDSKPVAMAYAESAIENTGCHWGLVFLNAKSLGSTGSWYANLIELIKDCGYFQDDSALDI